MFADCRYPSSKLCFCCIYLLETLDLGMRQWTFPRCIAVRNRDANAATNRGNAAVSSTVSARRGEGADLFASAGGNMPHEAGIQRRGSFK